VGDSPGNFIDLRSAGSAEDERNAVEQEPCGEGTKEKILDGRFGAFAVFFAVAGQNVGGDGGDFKGDEDHQQFDRRSHEAHANRAKDDEREILAAVVLVGRERVKREEQGNDDDAADQDMKEN